ncbi:stage II sporulation protein M [Algicola sagamiensis]|uniref:stage II sporulation protein M n=1 Tax=Algicola sagamiensis TaxID=163869 RepID=UPI00037EDEB0|nr:stage II sporulation protein M [Algicola sagamiensis]
MKQEQFIFLREKQWEVFENSIQSISLGSDFHKDYDFPHLYRQICHDLAIAKSRNYTPHLIDRLNQLVLDGQKHLYKPKTRFWYSLYRFIRYTFPQGVRDNLSWVVWAHVLFYGFALFAFVGTLIDPDFIYYIMSASQVNGLESMYNPESEHFGRHEERASDSDFYMFGFYILNNISLAFQTFVGGLVFCIGALFYLIFNGFYFGAVSAHIMNVGFNDTFFTFVITHGSVELTAIVLSAAAGIKVGARLIHPGSYRRGEAIMLAAREVYPLLLGAFLFLVLAAFIEAFWSSSMTVPNYLKYIVGSACWVSVYSYFYFGGRHGSQ